MLAGAGGARTVSGTQPEDLTMSSNDVSVSTLLQEFDGGTAAVAFMMTRDCDITPGAGWTTTHDDGTTRFHPKDGYPNTPVPWVWRCHDLEEAELYHADLEKVEVAVEHMNQRQAEWFYETWKRADISQWSPRALLLEAEDLL